MNYKEEVYKNTRFRQDYVDSLEVFLWERKNLAQEKRYAFMTPEKYAENPQKYYDEYIQLLGYPLNSEPVQTPKLLQKSFVTRDGDINIYRMQFAFFGGKIKFYGMYFEQTKNKENAPFVLGLHGGAGTPELVSGLHLNSANYNHLVRRLTDRGANVFSPQLLLWNVDRYGNTFDRIHTDGKLRQLGGSITALEIWLMRGCIDYFIAEENVNADRMGVAGLSYGGMYALHLAAAEPRLKACYSCSWVADIFSNSWGDWSYKFAQEKLTASEVMALVAPRRLVVAMGDKDEIFRSTETVAECERAKEFFKAVGKEENFKYGIFGGPHETDKSDEEFEFLFEKL